MAEPPREFAGRIIIEWPPAADALPGWRIKITDADTGKPINSVMGMTVIHVSASDIVWAECTMFAGRDGKPLLDGEAILDPGLDGGEILTGTFSFLVSEMRTGYTGRPLPERVRAMALKQPPGAQR